MSMAAGIENLPNEILSEIFVSCLPPDPQPDLLAAPMIFLNICHRWREIALALPALWMRIRIEFPRAREFEQVLDTWLTRARLRATSLSLRGSGDKVAPLLSAVAHHAPHVNTLALCFGKGRRLPDLVGPFSALTTLTISRDQMIPDPPENFAHTPSGCIAMMRAAPGLVECNFRGLYFGEQNPVHPPASSMLTHTSLRRLNLGCGGRGGNTGALLEYLTLPTLQTLFIVDFDIPVHIFSDFISRSAPPLEAS
ncbi:hypothetical protein DFH07DRAFT_963406 [Mycena maculata]|uniref:F-box domain-containing protein n=1 Tax=Mycena maculata TaxID=230809 RepID=A0AAD7IKD3_9AGAR|nr:hypothetical protein DFH07DRAFT_963406 [Mycena maculata]